MATTSVLSPRFPALASETIRVYRSGGSIPRGESQSLDPVRTTFPAMAAQNSIFAPAGALPPPPGFRVEAGYEVAEDYEPSARDHPASSGLHGALLPPPPAEQLVPAAVSTPTPFVPGSTVGVALAAFGLSAPLRHALLRAFECGEEDSADALAETPEAEVEEILGEMVVDDDDTRGPTRMEKGYVRSFFG